MEMFLAILRRCEENYFAERKDCNFENLMILFKCILV